MIRLDPHVREDDEYGHWDDWNDRADEEFGRDDAMYGPVPWS